MSAGLTIAVGVLVACVLITLLMSYLITRAPTGYQDEAEERFHYGEPPPPRSRRFEPGLHVVRDMSYFGDDDR